MKRVHIYAPLILSVVAVGVSYYLLATADARAEADAQRDFEAHSEFAWYRGRDGRADADADQAKGLPKWKEYGLNAGSPPWVTLVHERFGVSVEVIADCVVSKELLSYADSYNSRIEQFIAAKFGPDALSEARRSVRGSGTPSRTHHPELGPSALGSDPLRERAEASVK